MYFYEIWVRSNQYHSNSGLTYSSSEKLLPGQLVVVSLKDNLVNGIIIKSAASKPNIKIKQINQVIKTLKPLPKPTLDLMIWLHEYYPSSVGITCQQFIPTKFDLNLDPSSNTLSHTDQIDQSSLPPLTNDQLKAIKQINQSDTYIIHGRTGSGKTRIYIELAIKTFMANQSIIILTPEISLTAQLENQFSKVFLNNVVVLHSTLTNKERQKRWSKIASNQTPLVIIGPRSAIFSPLKNVGLIIIDEEHEPAYKQEQSPYYQAVTVASKLRQLHNAKLVLGSATPLVSDYFLAETRHKTIIRLNKLAQNNNLQQTNNILIDCHDRSLFGQSSYLSQPLIDLMRKAIARKEQVLLYLNRRGTARLIICDQCDWRANCKNCNLALTYHGDKHSLICHVCNYVQPVPAACPQCNNISIRYLTIGTKAIVEEASRIFPYAKIQRFDADNLKRDRLEQHYLAIRDGQVDIIVGTQILAKGLDLPKLSLVGVILADTSLQIPDFTANERTFQLVQQVIGRVGRGHINGTSIVQTYQPNSLTLKYALDNNWDSFYKQELNDRKKYLFPPYVHMLKLVIARSTSMGSQKAITKIYKNMPNNVIIEGPAPCFHELMSGKYRWQLVIKAKRRSDLLDIIKALPANITYDIDPYSLI